MFEGVFFEFPKAVSILFIFAGCESLCRMRLPGIFFPHLQSFARAEIRPSRWQWVLKWVTLALLTMALMSPVTQKMYEVKAPPGYQIALVIDASQSMRSDGFDSRDSKRSRFDVVKESVKRFIEERRNDEIGLIVFGQYAFIASPLSTESALLQQIVDRLDIAMAGKFTALYEAIAQSTDLLRRRENATRIAIVLTDGRNTPGGFVTPEIAMSLAIREQIKVYTIGIGTRDDYNADVLQNIATSTGATMFEAINASELDEVYSHIDRLEKSPLKPPPIPYKQYYYIYPLFFGFITLLLYVYLRNRRSDV